MLFRNDEVAIKNMNALDQQLKKRLTGLGITNGVPIKVLDINGGNCLFRCRGAVYAVSIEIIDKIT